MNWRVKDFSPKRAEVRGDRGHIAKLPNGSLDAESRLNPFRKERPCSVSKQLSFLRPPRTLSHVRHSLSSKRSKTKGDSREPEPVERPPGARMPQDIYELCIICCDDVCSKYFPPWRAPYRQQFSIISRSERSPRVTPSRCRAHEIMTGSWILMLTRQMGAVSRIDNRCHVSKALLFIIHLLNFLPRNLFRWR